MGGPEHSVTPSGGSLSSGDDVKGDRSPTGLKDTEQDDSLSANKAKRTQSMDLFETSPSTTKNPEDVPPLPAELEELASATLPIEQKGKGSMLLPEEKDTPIKENPQGEHDPEKENECSTTSEGLGTSANTALNSHGPEVMGEHEIDEDTPKTVQIPSDSPPKPFKGVSRTDSLQTDMPGSAMRLYKDAIAILPLIDETHKEIKEQLSRSIENFTSNVNKWTLKSTTPSPNHIPEKRDVLYRVRFSEKGQSDILWYQDVPFSGIDLIRSEPVENEDISIFDIIIDVEGSIAKATDVPSTETRKNWDLNKRKNIVFGRDVKLDKTKLPAIKIYSSKLLNVLNNLITYYPSQTGGLSFIAHPYKVLLLHYPLLAAYASTCKTQTPPLIPQAIEADEDIKLEGPAFTNGLDPDISKDEPFNDPAQLCSEREGHAVRDKIQSPKDEIYAILHSDTSLEPNSIKLWRDYRFETECDVETAHCIEVLLQCLTLLYQKEIIPELVLHRQEKATFKKLWVLFQPGIDIYATVNDQLAGFVVLSCEMCCGKEDAKNPQQTVDRVLITAWSLAFAGSKIFRDARVFEISSYDGERVISSLGVFPTKYLHEDGEPKRAKILQERGRKYYKIAQGNPTHRLYEGHTMETAERSSKMYKGEVIIDPRGYLENHPELDYELFMNEAKGRFHRDFDFLFGGLRRTKSSTRHHEIDDIFTKPSDRGGAPKWNQYNDIDPKTTEYLTDHQYFLLPQHILGFALGTKKWKILDLDNIHDLPEKHTEEVMSNLLLRPEAGDYVEIMRAVLAGPTQNQTDFIGGKGEARVILLHGRPGTGKTFTVECLAKAYQRPMLSLTVADLGNREDAMEEKLSTWFKLAEYWKAIMLIDEADVFLEERKAGDLGRNCLIAVFLRTMEYYSGILFLTSNRVGQIDSAFASRILIPLKYDLLPDEMRKKLWKEFINLNTNKDKTIEFSDKAERYIYSKEVTKMRLNGRDIRNAVHAAILLAKDAGHEPGAKVEVRKRHLEKILSKQKEFFEYQKSLYMMSPEERAWRACIRMDDGACTTKSFPSVSDDDSDSA